MKTKNPVAKHLRQFNKAVKFKDRKKALKRGYQKHRSRHHGGISVLWDREILCTRSYCSS